jgi:hypothetical protein
VADVVRDFVDVRPCHRTVHRAYDQSVVVFSAVLYTSIDTLYHGGAISLSAIQYKHNMFSVCLSVT